MANRWSYFERELFKFQQALQLFLGNVHKNFLEALKILTLRRGRS